MTGHTPHNSISTGWSHKLIHTKVQPRSVVFKPSPHFQPTGPRRPKKNGSRSNSRGSSGSRSSKGSSGKGARPSTPQGRPKKRTGTSPSGEKDRPACFRWLAGKCTKGKECKWWHSGPCADFAKGNCKKGKHCEFVHHTDKVKAAIKKTS